MQTGMTIRQQNTADGRRLDDLRHASAGRTRSNVYRIYYETNSAETDKSGSLTAQSGILYDSVRIVITGPPISLTHAYTGDADGNGFLDRLELHFSRATEFPCNFPKDSVIITYSLGNSTFTIDSINGCGDKDSIFLLFLKEEKGADSTVMQTGWLPRLSLPGLAGVNPISNFLCDDRAGPVIKSVTKKINTTGARDQDLVTVVFSEPVRDFDGRDVWLVNPPVVLFDLWTKIPSRANG